MEIIDTPTTFTAAWIIVLGLVALIVQAIAQQPSWSAGVKRWITVGIAVLLGTTYVVATGGISAVPQDAQAALVYWFIVVAGIIAVGQAVYGFLKPYLNRLEVATSPDVVDLLPSVAPESVTSGPERGKDASSTLPGGNDTDSTL